MIWRERLAALLFRWGFRLCSDAHARWLYRVQRDYYRDRGEGGL